MATLLHSSRSEKELVEHPGVEATDASHTTYMVRFSHI
jgi:hypothetical protein